MNSGTTGQFPYYAANGTALTATSSLFLATSGNVGIGTVAPSAQLHTTGSVRFATFGAGTLTTDASGNVTAASDERLKDIQGAYATSSLENLIQIDPILYKWNATSGMDTTTVYAGFSAQNLQKAIPEAIGTDPRGYLTVSDRPILATIVNALKEIANIAGLFRQKLISWLGSATNGLAALSADAITASTTNTTRLCVGDICVTPAQFKAMVASSAAAAPPATPACGKGEACMNTDTNTATVPVPASSATSTPPIASDTSTVATSSSPTPPESATSTTPSVILAPAEDLTISTAPTVTSP